MYLNGVQMPVTPSKLTVKIKGQNKTLNLVNDGEINFLRSPGLTEITVEVLLPMLQAYHFASYPSGYRPPDYYLSAFERMIAGKTPGRFILSRYACGRQAVRHQPAGKPGKLQHCGGRQQWPGRYRVADPQAV